MGEGKVLVGQVPFFGGGWGQMDWGGVALDIRWTVHFNSINLHGLIHYINPINKYNLRHSHHVILFGY
jgi:hypothetical protein